MYLATRLYLVTLPPRYGNRAGYNRASCYTGYRGGALSRGEHRGKLSPDKFIYNMLDNLANTPQRFSQLQYNTELRANT